MIVNGTEAHLEEAPAAGKGEWQREGVAPLVAGMDDRISKQVGISPLSGELVYDITTSMR